MSMKATDRNPVDRWRRATRATWCVGVAALALVSWWGLGMGDVSPRMPEVPALAQSRAGEPDPIAPLETRGFAKRLSPAPPLAVADAAPPAPGVPAIRLELLGIVRRETGFAAVLYDPADDRVHVVAGGDSVGEVQVRAVAERDVTLARAGESRTLRLERKERGSP